MGVDGLLHALSPCAERKALSDLAGQTWGVDGHSWIHELGSFYATAIVKEQNYDFVVRAVLRRAEVCKCEGIGLMFSFDGAAFSGKQRVLEARARRRAKALAGIQQAEDDDANIDIERLYHTALAITPELLAAVQNALIQQGYLWIQAPFESDGQLTLMCKEGLLSGVCCNDVDFLVHGCPRAMYHTRFLEGYGDYFEFEKLFGNDLATISITIELKKFKLINWVSDVEQQV